MWNAIIRAAGGQVPTRRNSPLLTYFLLLDEMPADKKLLDQARMVGKLILTKEWLCQSLIRQHRLETDEFEVVFSGVDRSVGGGPVGHASSSKSVKSASKASSSSTASASSSRRRQHR
jgi:hypothetical protein